MGRLLLYSFETMMKEKVLLMPGSGPNLSILFVYLLLEGLGNLIRNLCRKR